MKTWAIYNAPAGSPAPLVVMQWEGAPGERPRHGVPIFAANLERARALVPRGLVCHEPSKARAEDPKLIETWEPAE